LVTAINEVAAKQKTALALPELRCTFGNRSIVPDIAIFSWDHIPLDQEGDIADRFNTAPDWVIEILSPDQNQSKVTANILYCLQASCQMGWLIDPMIKSILVYPSGQQPEFFQESDQLLLIPDFVPNLRLTMGDLFSW
jgi:Uma2 family endonuclease